MFFLQERRGRSSPWVPSLRRHRDHHHERVPQVQVRSPSMSRLLRSHTPGMTRAKKSHIFNDVTHNLFQGGWGQTFFGKTVTLYNFERGHSSVFFYLSYKHGPVPIHGTS